MNVPINTPIKNHSKVHSASLRYAAAAQRVSQVAGDEAMEFGGLEGSKEMFFLFSLKP